MIKKLMNALDIKYYDYSLLTKTLTIYEAIPVKVLVFLRSQLKDIKINIKD